MILFVPNFSVMHSGDGRYVPKPDYEFLNALSYAGLSFNVMSFEAKKNDPFMDYSLTEIPNIRLRSIGIHSGAASNISKIVSYGRGILHSIIFVLMHKDLIYIYFPGHIPLIVGLVCALFNKRYALYVRGIWNTTGLFSKLSNYVFRNAAFIFTTGVGFAKQIETFNPNVTPVFPMTSFNTGVTLASSPAKSDELHEALFVGHAREKKGVLDAIRSIALARERGVDICLKIVGGGDDADLSKIDTMIQELNLDGCVEYVGHVSDVEKLTGYFSTADVFIYPSYYPEGFPRVVYEAMLFGLPIICTILPGMLGFMKDQHNCIEVPPKSPERICVALMRLEKDAIFRKKLGRMARESIRSYLESFPVKGHANQFYEKYQAVMAHG